MMLGKPGIITASQPATHCNVCEWRKNQQIAKKTMPECTAHIFLKLRSREREGEHTFIDAMDVVD